MATGKFVAYYRVSTEEQGKSGLGTEAQKFAVHTHLNGGKWKLVAEVEEVESGKHGDRPELLRALQLCRIHNATLIIAKLDRLSRSVSLISNLMESGVDFVALDCLEANRFTLHVLAAVAEHEARCISERTKVALAAAKRRGVVLGGHNPNIAREAAKGAAASAAVRGARASKLASDLMPVLVDIKACGHTSWSAIARELNNREIPTPSGKGKKWLAVQVQRIQASA